MLVPFIDLKRFEPGFLNKWQQKIAVLSETASFIGGSEVSALEQSLTQYLGVSHAVSCANGTDAIQLALRALDVGEGDVVVIPDMTFWATFEAVVNVGAKVVTVDIAMADGGIDLDCFTEALTKYKPKAAIIAHLFGWASGQLQSIRELCQQSGVALLEDGAQCFGTEFQGRSIYKGALITTTSFYPAKVLGAAGDGGAVFTNDEVLATRARQLSNHGRTSHYGHGLVGWNSRLDSFQAAYLNLSLPHLNDKIASRQQSAAYYREHLSNDHLKVIDVPTGFTENGYCNVCLIADRDYKQRLQDTLKAKGIGFGNIYPSPMSEQPAAAPHLAGKVGGQHAEKWCTSVLNLPLFPYMTRDELDSVVALVNEFK